MPRHLNPLLGAVDVLPLAPLGGASLVPRVPGAKRVALWERLRTNPLVFVAGVFVGWRVFARMA